LGPNEVVKNLCLLSTRECCMTLVWLFLVLVRVRTATRAIATSDDGYRQAKGTCVALVVGCGVV
ncbi:hypothetical protein ACJX0J_029704, partial [Zea mays]